MIKFRIFMSFILCTSSLAYATDGKLNFTIPTGWTLEQTKMFNRVTSPEKDLSIYFVETSKIDDFQKLAIDSWKQVKPEFNSKVLQVASPPASDGWDEFHQIMYDVPAKDSRVLIAIIRNFKKQSYITLVDGTNEALSRRGAQLSEAIESLKPNGLIKEDLSKSPGKKWGESESIALEAFVKDAMKRLQIPGASVTIVQGKQMVYSEGFGVTSVDTKKPVNENTLFMIGSTTKPLTTFMMAKLIDEGKLTWNTPMTKILPSFSLADPDLTKKIELQHTACACTGMPRHDMDFIFKFTGITAEDRINQMKDMKPTTALGETFQYSNYLVALGGYAAAHVYEPNASLEKAYNDAMENLVFKPLGMTSTIIGTADAIPEKAASGHGLNLDGKSEIVPMKMEGAVFSVAPAGAVWSSGPDLARYEMVELNRGVTPEGKRVVSEDALLKRRQKGVKITDDANYGLGLFVATEQGLNVMSHGGNTLGFSSDLYFIPEKNFGSVVLTNTANAGRFTSAVKQKILELEYGAEKKSADMVKYSEGRINDRVKRTKLKISFDTKKNSWVKKLIGNYSNPNLGTAEVRSTTDGYEIQFSEWKSKLGEETDSDGQHLIAFVSTPWEGDLELLIDQKTKDLILDDSQTKYIFKKL